MTRRPAAAPVAAQRSRAPLCLGSGWPHLLSAMRAAPHDFGRAQRHLRGRVGATAPPPPGSWRRVRVPGCGQKVDRGVVPKDHHDCRNPNSSARTDRTSVAPRRLVTASPTTKPIDIPDPMTSTRYDTANRNLGGVHPETADLQRLAEDLAHLGLAVSGDPHQGVGDIARLQRPAPVGDDRALGGVATGLHGGWPHRGKPSDDAASPVVMRLMKIWGSSIR